MTVATAQPTQGMSGYLDTVRAELIGLTDSDLVQRVREIEELSRQTYSVMLNAVAEVQARGIAEREGFGNTARLLAGMLRLSSGRRAPGWSRPPPSVAGGR